MYSNYLIKNNCLLIIILSMSTLIFAANDDDFAPYHTKVYFGKSDFNTAFFYAQKVKNIDDNILFIKGESLFNLGHYQEALKFFLQLKQPIVRVFDCYVFLKKVADASEVFTAFEKSNKTVPSRMLYAIGKLFAEKKETKKAQELLEKIKPKSMHYIRSQYILATIDVSNNKYLLGLNRFKTIIGSPAMCVEDKWVIELAKLAVARIYWINNNYDQSVKHYEKVLPQGGFFHIAISEMVEMALVQKKIFHATNAISRYRSFYEIDTSKPYLMTNMASFMVSVKRFNDARVICDSLINYYRSIYQSLTSKDDKDLSLLKIFEKIPEILLVKDEKLNKIKKLDYILLKHHRQIEILKEKNKLVNDASSSKLIVLQKKHDEINKKYSDILALARDSIAYKQAYVINKFLAQIESLRASLVVEESKVSKIKSQYIEEIQSDNIKITDQLLESPEAEHE